MNDFTQMSQKFDPNGGPVEFGDDSKLFVEFTQRPVMDEVKSKEEGRPVYKAVDYIRIRQPAERDEILRPAHQMDIRRFPRHWQAYQDGRQEIPEGTPLVTLFPVNPEIVENLKIQKIFVVEQLAVLSDTQIGNIGMGGRHFVDRAKAFMAAADKGKDYHALAKKIEALEASSAADKKQIESLQSALTKASTKKERSTEAA